MTTWPERDLTGRTVLVTGGTSGIGRATAVASAERGARVVLAVRDVEKGRAVAAELAGGAAAHAVELLDLADLDSVRSLAARWTEPIDLLVNNAGVSTVEREETRDGFERQIGTNHLGHFLLTSSLLAHVAGRVVTVASQAERMGRLDLDDLGWQSRPWNGPRAYADSKLANLLFTLELDRRLRSSGSPVRALAAHPGLVRTAIYDRADAGRPGLWDRLVPLLGQSPEQGALPSLQAMTDDLPGGTFTGPRHLLHMRGGSEVIGFSRRAADPALAAELWTLSERLVDR